MHPAAALVLVLFGAHGPEDAVPRTPQTTSAAPVTGRSAKVDLLAFRDELDKLRGGDESVLPVLSERAARLKRDFDRPDVALVLDFFRRLTIEERQRGLAAEGEYNRARAEVMKRATVDVWREKRPRVLADLDDLIKRNARAADFTPAARALALRARIGMRRVVDDYELDPETKNTWAEEGRVDARESLELFERAGMLTPRLEPIWILATLDYATGRTDAANEGFDNALRVARRVENEDFQVRSLEGSLRIAQDAGDLPVVSALLLELAGLTTPAQSWNLARNQARLLLWFDEPERATEFLVRNKPKSGTDLPDWHVLMSAAQSRQGDAGLAEVHAEAVDGTNAILAKADVLRRSGDAEGAQSLLDDSSGDLDPRKLNVLKRVQLLQIRGATFLALGQRTNAISAFEEALEIGESLESRLASLGTAPSTNSVFGEAVGLEMVAMLARALVENGEALAAAHVVEGRQSRALRGQVARGTSADFSRDDLLAWAHEFELGFVTWVVGADTSVVVHVAREGIATAATIAVGRHGLEGAVRRVREACIAGNARAAADLGAEIQAVLLPPELLTSFPTSSDAEIPRLLVLAHGPLERMPFTLLPIFATSSGHPVVPVILPGLPERAPGSPQTQPKFREWSILGNPLDAHGSSLLPGAREELAAVAALHPGSARASPATFVREALLAALTDKKSLHIATHLRTSAGERESRLAHAGFELTNGDVFGIDDIRRAHPKLPLAVLSACETGSGRFIDAQAADGVARAFLESGTRNVLVTLWPVEDEAARQFAVAFHRALAAGQIPSRAALFACESMRASGASSADWAAFRLLGRD